jgi:hypothetical protein
MEGRPACRTVLRSMVGGKGPQISPNQDYDEDYVGLEFGFQGTVGKSRYKTVINLARAKD